MTTHSTEPYFTKRLTELLKQLEAHRAAAGEYEKTIAGVDAEEKQLLETANLNDPKQFKKISAVRLKKDLLPRKIARMNEMQEEVLDRINKESNYLMEAMGKDLRAILFDGIGLVSGRISPFFPDDQKSWEDNSARVFKNTRWGLWVAEYTGRFQLDTVRHNEPELKGKHCLTDAKYVSDFIASYLEFASRIRGK